MKKPKKPEFKKPETIADLKIDWTFEQESEETNCSKFIRLNPDLTNIKLKGGEYNFIFGNISFQASPYPSESLNHFIDYMSYCFMRYVGKNIELSHFEKLSETEYRIHGKEV